jgi:CRP/FNR family transcriptional regulator, cyclic AMP receptor protein
MPLSPGQLGCIPLLRGLPDHQIQQLAAIFEPLVLPEGEVLFRDGDPATSFYLLTAGEVGIQEGAELRYRLRPPAPIGELGALAGLHRNTTAVVTERAELWKATRETALGFFAEHRDIALPFYQNLVHLIADKVGRDQTRLDDMRHNIVRTQKAMKRMRDLLLESPETPLSEALHGNLEQLIQNNRRVNYRLEPPTPLPARVRLDNGSTLPVVQISRTHLRYQQEEGQLPGSASSWSGVLWLSGPEIPLSGKVLRTIGPLVDIELDLLFEDYGAILDGYLTRVQMLDFMV